MSRRETEDDRRTDDNIDEDECDAALVIWSVLNSILSERPEPRKEVASAGEYRKFAMRKLRRRVRIIITKSGRDDATHVRTRDMCAEPSIDRTVHAATALFANFECLLLLLLFSRKRRRLGARVYCFIYIRVNCRSDRSDRFVRRKRQNSRAT